MLYLRDFHNLARCLLDILVIMKNEHMIQDVSQADGMKLMHDSFLDDATAVVRTFERLALQRADEDEVSLDLFNRWKREGKV